MLFRVRVERNMGMSDRIKKSYKEWKEELRKRFHIVTDCQAYRERTYVGKDFVQKIKDWEDAWFGLIYDSTDFNGKDENGNRYWNDPTTFEYKICKWSHWDHNLNHELRQNCWDWTKEEYNKPFQHPEFLDDMFFLTFRFLNAKTREEESEVLDTTYRIDFKKHIKDENGVEKSVYETQKYIWISEENVGKKSEYLPLYLKCSYKNVFKRKTKKWWDNYRNELSKWLDDKQKDEVIEEEKELQKIVKLAVKKKLIINIEDKNESK